MQTATGITAEQFARSPEARHSELIDGVVVPVTPPGFQHGRIAGGLMGRLWQHVQEHQLGVVLAESGYVLSREPDTVRAPDLSFVAGPVELADEPTSWSEQVPDLAVEVVSPNDTEAEVLAKARAWVDAGVRLVWVVWPAAQAVTELRPGVAERVLHPGAELDGADVVPGFRLEVGAIF